MRPLDGPLHLFFVMEQSNGFHTAVDEVLVGHARPGDPNALEAISRLFERAAFTLARRIGPNSEFGIAAHPPV